MVGLGGLEPPTSPLSGAFLPAICIHLPDIRIHGNTHFPMSDLNNIKIADQMSKFLSEKKLD
jgi:hypothetical protein